MATSMLLLIGGVLRAPSQSSTPPGTPEQWMQRAAANELPIIRNDGSFPLRYSTRKVDRKGDTTREVIESREGTVARLVQRNGQPLTREEDGAEQLRLQDILGSPADFIKHHQKDAAARSYSSDLVQLLPSAMRYSYAAGQPQPPGADGPQVVIDFMPDPTFRPPTLAADLLTGLAGRFWISERTGRMSRAEVHVIHPVSLGWGLLGSVHEGGTVEFEQAEVGEDRWAYSHLEEHITARLLLKTEKEDTSMSAWNFHLLPSAVSFQEAVRTLLAMQVPTRR